MSLEKLVQLGWYKAEPSGPREIADLYSIVDRSQADMKVEGISARLKPVSHSMQDHNLVPQGPVRLDRRDAGYGEVSLSEVFGNVRHNNSRGVWIKRGLGS